MTPRPEMCRAEAGGQVNEPSSPRPAENCWWAWLLRTVSWRVSGIFRIIIVKPLIWKYTEMNPLVGGSAWLPAEGLCYLAQPWNNSGSVGGRLRVAPPTPAGYVFQRQHLVGRDSRSQRDRSDASRGWEWQGQGYADWDPHRKRKKKDKQAISWAFHANFILELSHCKWDEKEGSSKENNRRNGPGGPPSLWLLP